MKVDSVEIEYFKRVTHVAIYTSGQSVELVGKNEAGKSSVLDAIRAAMAGAKAIDPAPLHDGQRKGSIKLAVGELIIERHFSRGNVKGRLTITDPSGRKWGQRDLDELWGMFTFDPLAFTRLQPRQQVEQLQALAGDAFVQRLAELDSAIKVATRRRADAKRDLERIGQVAVPEKVAPVDITEVHQQLESADAFNRRQRQLRRDLDTIMNRCGKAQTAVAEAEKALKAAQHELALADQALDEAPKPEAEIDTSDLTQKIVDASRINAAAGEYDRAVGKLTQRTHAAQVVNEFEDQIAELRGTRAAHAASVQLPVPGLTWTPDGVELHGLPFEQHSSSKRLRVAALIGMAQSPALRIMRVDDGSLLDQDSFNELLQLAEDHDVQLWVETVGAGHEGDHLIVEIVDGQNEPEGRPF